MQHRAWALAAAALLVPTLSLAQGSTPDASPATPAPSATGAGAPSATGAGAPSPGPGARPIPDEAPPDQAAPPAASASTSPPISDEARRHFRAGVALLEDPEGARVEEAYLEFKTAYDLSGSPKILGNMGYCAMKLERDGEAIDAYSTYLRDVADIDPQERAQITRDLQTLTVGVARVTVEADKPGVRIVDVRVPVRGDRVTNAYGPLKGDALTIGMRPGRHLVTAKLDGYEDSTWEVEVYAGSRDKHAFTMRPRVVASAAPAPIMMRERHGPSPLPWIVAGTGAAMMIGGAITGVVALGKTSDISNACPNDTCPKSFDLESQRSDARTFVRLTDLLLIGGGVLVAGGVTWAVLAGGREEEHPKAAPPPQASLRPSFACGGSGCMGSVGGTF